MAEYFTEQGLLMSFYMKIKVQVLLYTKNV